MSQRKKKILIQSNASFLKSGFGRNSRQILSFLFEKQKYDIVEYACNSNLTFSDKRCSNLPWKCYGSLPDNPNDINHLNDPSQLRAISYGALNIDKIIEIERPDVYFHIEDIWSATGYWDKQWWKHLTPALWTTLDSVPIIPLARDNAAKIPNFWVWASFAEREMHKLGFNHVKTVPGVFPMESFKPLPDNIRVKARDFFKLSDDTIVFGFVFRNQLRKLVGSLLEGFKEFKTKNPQIKTKVLLHTNWAEGWSIPEFIKEFGINPEDVLTTYYCSNCKEIDITPFHGQGIPCRFCRNQNSMNNPSIANGCSEEQLNVVYNLMDAYIHPITSGGLEMPIVEAMLTGLPVSTVGYSCGEDFTQHNFVHSISYSTYRECGSNFIKASANSSSIANFMQKFSSNREKYKKFGLEGRNWALEYFDINRIGSIIESLIDNSPYHTLDEHVKLVSEPRNDSYQFKEINDETEWLIDMYKNILKMIEPTNSEGVLHWRNKLSQGVSRKQVYDFFIHTAKQENQKLNKIKLESFFEENGKKRLVYIIPKSLGDCVISLSIIDELRKTYVKEEWDLYVCTEQVNFQIFQPLVGNLIKNLIPYSTELDNYKLWEGCGEHKGVCEIAMMPYGCTQRFESYTHNGLDINLLQNN